MFLPLHRAFAQVYVQDMTRRLLRQQLDSFLQNFLKDAATVKKSEGGDPMIALEGREEQFRTLMKSAQPPLSVINHALHIMAAVNSTRGFQICRDHGADPRWVNTSFPSLVGRKGDQCNAMQLATICGSPDVRRAMVEYVTSDEFRASQIQKMARHI